MKFDLVIAMAVMAVVHVPRLADGVPIDIHPARRFDPTDITGGPAPSAPTSAPTNSTVTGDSCTGFAIQSDCNSPCQWDPATGCYGSSPSPPTLPVSSSCSSHTESQNCNPPDCMWDDDTSKCVSRSTGSGSGSGSAALTPSPSYAPATPTPTTGGPCVSNNNPVACSNDVNGCYWDPDDGECFVSPTPSTGSGSGSAAATPAPTLACSGREQYQCLARDSCVWDSGSCGTLTSTYTLGTYSPVPAASTHSGNSYSACTIGQSSSATSAYWYTYISYNAQTCIDNAKWPDIEQGDFCGHVLGNTPRLTQCGADDAAFKSNLANGFSGVSPPNIKNACRAWGNVYGGHNLQAQICSKCVQDGGCTASSATPAATPEPTPAATPEPTPTPTVAPYTYADPDTGNLRTISREHMKTVAKTIQPNAETHLNDLKGNVEAQKAMLVAIINGNNADHVIMNSSAIYEHPMAQSKPKVIVYPSGSTVRGSDHDEDTTFRALTVNTGDWVIYKPKDEISEEAMKVTKLAENQYEVESLNGLVLKWEGNTLSSGIATVSEGTVMSTIYRKVVLRSITDAGPPCPTSIDLIAAVTYNNEKTDSLFAQTGVVDGTIVPATYTLQSISLDGVHTVDAGQRLPGFLRKDTVITASVLSDSGDVVTDCPVTNPLGDRSRGAIQEIWGSNRAVLDDHYGNTFSPHTLEIADQTCGKIGDSGEKPQLSSSKTEIDASCQRNGDCASLRMDECSLNIGTMDSDAETSSNPLSTYCQLRNGNAGSENKYTQKAKLYNVHDNDGMTRGVLPRHGQARSDYAVYTHPTGDLASTGVTAKSSRAAQRQTGIIAIDDRLAAENRDLWIASQTKVDTIASVGGGYATAFAEAFLGLSETPAADAAMEIYQSVRISGNNSDTNVQHWAERAPTIHVKPSKSAFEGGSEASGCAQSAPVNFAVIDESVLADCHVIDDNGNPSVLTQIRESPAVNTEVHVCVSESDQETLLSQDDRFENIVNYFNEGEIRFETSDGEIYSTTHPRVVSSSGGGDKQICFVMKNLAEPPRCNCESTTCSSSTDLFQSRITTDASNADVLRNMAAPSAYTCTNEPVSSRVYTASVEDSAGMSAWTGLDGDLESLIAGTVDSTTANAADCGYTEAIRELYALKVKSNKHLRIRAAAGLQKQIAVRIGVYQTYGALTLDQDGANVLGLTNAATYDRVSVRSALTMVAFQPYATGVCGNAACGSLTDFIGNAALPVVDQVDSKQSSIQQIPDIAAAVQYGSNDAVLENYDALDFNSKLGDANGGCMAWERTKTDTDTLRLAETTRIDFRIKETTTCSYKGVRAGDQKSQSKEERHWFGADCASENEIAQARVVRAMFSSNYDDVTFDLSLYEYGCDTMEHHYYIDGTTMESLEAKRIAEGETWTEVVNAVIENLKVKFPYDYSTHACGDLTFDAFVGVQDVRSCGHKNYALQDSTDFAKFTISTRSKDDAEYDSDKALQIDFNAQLSGGALDSEVHPQVTLGGSQKYLTMYYDDAIRNQRQVTSDTPCNENHVWTIGDSSNSSTAQYPRSTVASSVSRDAGILDYDVETRWDKSRDHDYQASLEITDFTDIVSSHDYHTGSGACAYDSDILALVKQVDQDAHIDDWSHLAEIDRLSDAAFVLSHCFTLSGTDVATAETAASAIDRGFAYQMIHDATVAEGDCSNGDAGRSFGGYGGTPCTDISLWPGSSNATKCANAAAEKETTVTAIADACPCTCGSGGVVTDPRKFRRYSIFASVDAFAIASGLDLDVQQGCVPCSDILTKAGEQSFFGVHYPDTSEFVNQCVRSRAAMHGAVNADGCPVNFDGANTARSALSLLSSQFPAFVTRPGSRDPHRVSVSLDIYDWMNRNTQVAASTTGTVTSVDVTRSGLQFFTVAPQCSASPVGAISDTPFHDDDFKCKIEWDVTHSGSVSYIEYAENAATGDDLHFKIPDGSKNYASSAPDGIAKAHQNAVRMTKTFESGDGATENFNWGETDSSEEYAFEQNSACAPLKVCLTPCDDSESDCTKVGGSPVGKNRETYTRVSLARVLTHLHDAHAAQSESLTDADQVDRCAQRSWTNMGVNSDLARVTLLDEALIAAAMRVGGAEGLLTLDDLNSVLHKHLTTGQLGVYGNSSQQHIDHCQRHCSNGASGSGCGAPDVLDAYSMRADTQFGASNYRDTTVFPSGERDAYDRVGYGAFMNPDCSNLEGYTQSTLSAQPDHGNTYAETKGSNENFDLVLNFLKEYNSQSRNMLTDTADANGCDRNDDFLSFGMQVAMTSESKTRSEYAGGSVIVSHCEVLPGNDADAIDQDQSDSRQLYVKASLLEQDANNKQQQVRFPSDASAAISKTYWRDDTATNKERMFEVDQYNIDDRTKVKTGHDHSARSDTLALTVAFDFNSTDAHYQDLRPVNFTMDITQVEGGSQINDLFDAYIVLDDIDDAGTVWAKEMSQSEGAKNLFDFDFKSVNSSHSARYMPVQRGISAVSPGLGKSSCMYLMTVADHNPTNDEPVNYMTEIVDIATQWSHASACHKIKIVPKTTNLGFDRINVRTCAWVKDSGDNSIMVKDCTDTDVEVVNVAGQPLQCVLPHQINPHKVIRTVDPLSVSDPVCAHVAGGEGEQLRAMETGKFAVIAQSSLGRISSFVRLSVNVGSTTFSQISDFDGASGVINLDDQQVEAGYKSIGPSSTPQAVKKMYNISCEYDTTCKMYGEAAYLNLVTDNDIQLARTEAPNPTEPNEFKLRRYAPLSDATANATIAHWANAAAPATTSKDYSKDHLYGQFSVGDYTVVSALDVDPIDPAVESDYDQATGAKGGRMFRVLMAKTSVICAGAGNTDCSVGYQISPDAGDDEQVDNLVYAAGSKIHADNHINFKMFITTFTYEDDDGLGVISIDADGYPTRSGVVEWNVKVATMADIGGVCMRSARISGESAFDTSFFDSYDAKNMTELGEKTPKDIIDEIYDETKVGAPVVSTKDLEDGGDATHYRDLTFKLSDSTFASRVAATQAVDVSFTRVTMTKSASDRFDSASNYDLQSASILKCESLNSKQLGLCVESGDKQNVVVKMGSERAHQEETLTVKVAKQAGVADTDSDNHIMVCLGIHTVESTLFENNIVKQCQELCFIALDPDIQSTTDCDHVSCPADIAAFEDEQTLAEVKCDTTVTADHAKKLWTLKTHGVITDTGSKVIQTFTAPISLANITRTRESQLKLEGTSDLTLDSSSVGSADATDTDFGGSGAFASISFDPATNAVDATLTGSVDAPASGTGSISDSFDSGDVTIESRTTTIKLLSSQDVATDSDLKSGRRCMAIPQLDSTGFACPYTEVKTQNTKTDTLCRTFRTEYATGADAGSYGSADTACYGTVADDCNKVGLKKLGLLESSTTTRAGTRASGVGNDADLKTPLMDTYSACSSAPGAYKTQMSSEPETCVGQTAMAGVYAFPQNKLFRRDGLNCVAGSGLALELESGVDASAIVVDSAVLDFGTSRQQLCVASNGKTMITPIGDACANNPIVVEGSDSDRTLRMTEVSNMCDLMSDKSILRVNLQGRFGTDASADRYITLVFANSASGGVIEIDTDNTVVDAAKMGDASPLGDAWTIAIKRTSAAAGLANLLSLSRFGVDQEGGSGVTIEDRWVSLKVCTENVIGDAFGYKMAAPAQNSGAYTSMTASPRTRLSSIESSNLICGESFVRIAADETDVKIKSDRSDDACSAAGDCQVFYASLCRDIEHMSECLVLPASANVTAPDASLVEYLQRTEDSVAVEVWNAGFSLATENRPIKCNPTSETQCGYKNTTGTCAAAAVHFKEETSSANVYTAWVRSGLTGHYESHKDSKHTVTLQIAVAGKYCLAMSAEEENASSLSCIVADAAAASKAECALSAHVISKLDSASCPSDSTRLACFDWSEGEQSVDIVARPDLGSSAIDYLHLFKECDGGSCAPSSTDRFAIVVLPMRQDNFYGAHGLSSSSNSGMNFGNIRFDTNNRIHIEYELGQYRPSGGCTDHDEDNGVGYPSGATDQQKRRCRDWGDDAHRGDEDRGFSPKLCTLQLGEGQGLNIDSPNKVFGRDYTDDDACSLSRNIGDVWAGANGKVSFAKALFTGELTGIGDASDTRKTCSGVSGVLGQSASDTPWNALYSPSTPMTYRSPHTESNTTDPSYDMKVVESDSTEGAVCDSKYRVQGNIQVSLEKARSCHHEKNVGQWVPIADQTITDLDGQDEVVTVQFPVTMRCYSASKPRASGSEITVTEEKVKTDVTVYTRTYSAGNTSTVKSTDIPAVYLHSTKLEDASSATKTVDDKTVNTQCYDDCTLQGLSASAACQSDCATSCQVVQTLNPDGTQSDIPGLFGYLNIDVNVESLHGTAGSPEEHPLINDARAFGEVSGLEAVGSFNAKEVKVLPEEAGSCTHKVSKTAGSAAESTVSKLRITTVVKRLLDVSGVAPAATGVMIMSGDLLPDKDAFNRGRSAGCACDTTTMPALSPHSPHPKCTFDDATDYAFQVQTRQCADGAINGLQCLEVDDASCATAGGYRTVQMYLTYENNKQFINKQEIKTSMNDPVSQGAFFKGDTDPTSLGADAAQNFVDQSAVGENDRLVQGESVFMTQEVLNGVSKLGRSWQLHTQTASTAILSEECDTTDSDCEIKGYQTGQCGVNIDGTSDHVPKHIMSKVILPESTSNTRTSASELQQLWKSTAYFKRVRAALDGAAQDTVFGSFVKKFGQIGSDFDLCFTTRGGLDNALQINKNSAAAWCVADHLKSIWDGSEAVTGFLETLRKQTCDNKNRVLLCTSSVDVCYVFGTAQDHSANKLCMALPDHADGFKDHFRIMEIVREYEYQSNKVALENFVPGPTIETVCSDQITASETDKYQVPFGDPNLPQCAQMDRAVHASFRSKVQDLVSSSQAADSLISGDARRAQCLGRAKSDRLTDDALGVPREYTIKDRSPMRQHLHFGSSFIIPCVPRIAYMESRVTDTRSTCAAADGKQVHIFKDGTTMKVRRSLPVSYSSDALKAEAGQDYELYYDPSSSCDVADGICTGLSQTGTTKSAVYMPPVSKICGTNDDDSMEAVESYGDLQWAHGVLTFQNHPVFISSDGKPAGFEDVPNSVCSGGSSRRSAEIGGRHLLTVHTASSGGSNIQEVEMRRSADGSSTNDISIVTTVSLAAGSHQTATCSNMNTCAGHYTPKPNSDSLQCTDNVDEQCSLSYCCDLVGVTHITVRADCTSLGSSHTQMRMLYVASMTIAFFALILIVGHMIAVRIKQLRCSNVIERQRLCEKPTIVVALEVVAVMMFLVSAIVGLIGQGDDAWISTCGLDNNAGWNAWVPLLLALLIGGYYGRQYYMNRNSQCDAAPARPDIFSAGEAQL